MPCLATFQDTFQRQDSGAFEVNKNLGTIAGVSVMGAGAALAVGVGTAVAPAPVIGLLGLGGGLTAAGNWKELKAHFTEGDSESASTSKKAVAQEAAAA